MHVSLKRDQLFSLKCSSFFCSRMKQSSHLATRRRRDSAYSAPSLLYTPSLLSMLLRRLWRLEAEDTWLDTLSCEEERDWRVLLGPQAPVLLAVLEPQ